jgi:hypothetical protein
MRDHARQLVDATPPTLPVTALARIVHTRSLARFQPAKGEVPVYIGFGTLVVILVIVLIVYFIRRA